MIEYRSTRTRSLRVAGFGDACRAVQPADGGLFVPERIPELGMQIGAASTFVERAVATLAPWVEDEIPFEILEAICHAAFDFPVPIVPLDPETTLVELFHGPTAAFKDFGARFLARVVPALRPRDAPLTVLVATSGDTGAAVAHAFSGLATARVVLLYPGGRVSPLQELQLTAVPENTMSLRVDGTFDDCQKMVRTAFADESLVQALGLVAANSIHVARLLPQIAYYVHAALELAGGAKVPHAGMPGKHRTAAPVREPPLVVVPSGNLGNLTAGLLAKRMGAPIGRFLAATNRNDGFVRFLASGRAEPHPTFATPSNAMDVGNPSNLERIRALYEGDQRGLRRDISAESIDDESTLACMRRVLEEHGRFVCPHTAVGLAALALYRYRTKDRTHAIVLATAHPGKFDSVVQEATGHSPPVPPSIAALEPARRPPRQLRADPAAFVTLLRRHS